MFLTSTKPPIITAKVKFMPLNTIQVVCHPTLSINHAASGGKAKPASPPVATRKLILNDLLAMNQLLTSVVQARYNPNPAPNPTKTPKKKYRCHNSLHCDIPSIPRAASEFPKMMFFLGPNFAIEAPINGLGNPKVNKARESPAPTAVRLQPRSSDITGRNTPYEKKNVPPEVKKTSIAPARTNQP
jgi:hypothetical protein